MTMQAINKKFRRISGVVLVLLATCVVGGCGDSVQSAAEGFRAVSGLAVHELHAQPVSADTPYIRLAWQAAPKGESYLVFRAQDFFSDTTLTALAPGWQALATTDAASQVTASDSITDVVGTAVTEIAEVSFVDRDTEWDTLYYYRVQALDGQRRAVAPSQIVAVRSNPQPYVAPEPVSETVYPLPIKLDSDNDGLTDGQEALLGTNPQVADTDGDGLSDGEEYLHTGTNPLANDTDNDGMPDGREVQFKLQAFVADADADADGDGISNGDELLVWQTDPNKKDSDGDGAAEGYEISRGTNPARADDHPACPFEPTAYWYVGSITQGEGFRDAGKPDNGAQGNILNKEASTFCYIPDGSGGYKIYVAETDLVPARTATNWLPIEPHTARFFVPIAGGIPFYGRQETAVQIDGHSPRLYFGVQLGQLIVAGSWFESNATEPVGYYAIDGRDFVVRYAAWKSIFAGWIETETTINLDTGVIYTINSARMTAVDDEDTWRNVGGEDGGALYPDTVTANWSAQVQYFDILPGRAGIWVTDN